MTCRIEPAILQINSSKCTQRLYGEIGRSVGLNETNEANEETEESEAIEALLTNTFRPLSRSIVFSKINTSSSNWDSSPRRTLALHRRGGGGGTTPQFTGLLAGNKGRSGSRDSDQPMFTRPTSIACAGRERCEEVWSGLAATREERRAAPDRTWQSLKEHWRVMAPLLRNDGRLTEEQRRRMCRGRIRGGRLRLFGWLPLSCT